MGLPADDVLRDPILRGGRNSTGAQAVAGNVLDAETSASCGALEDIADRIAMQSQSRHFSFLVDSAEYRPRAYLRRVKPISQSTQRTSGRVDTRHDRDLSAPGFLVGLAVIESYDQSFGCELKAIEPESGRVLATQHPGKGDEIECLVPLARQAVRATGHDLPDVLGEKCLLDLLPGSDFTANRLERFADKRVMGGREKAVGFPMKVRDGVQPARQRRCL